MAAVKLKLKAAIVALLALFVAHVSTSYDPIEQFISSLPNPKRDMLQADGVRPKVGYAVGCTCCAFMHHACMHATASVIETTVVLEASCLDKS